MYSCGHTCLSVRRFLRFTVDLIEVEVHEHLKCSLYVLRERDVFAESKFSVAIPSLAHGEHPSTLHRFPSACGRLSCMSCAANLTSDLHPTAFYAEFEKARTNGTVAEVPPKAKSSQYILQ